MDFISSDLKVYSWLEIAIYKFILDGKKDIELLNINTFVMLNKLKHSANSNEVFCFLEYNTEGRKPVRIKPCFWISWEMRTSWELFSSIG